ncbi:MAG: nucleotidyl transferase AbiEii/AbiGii toxin family protein [Hyphomonadaceae bacterium]|nr:nucleotidyl transferase AbiEii/AbiGii toxin family protein [Hyphomonadaceae bacterium]
MTTNIAASVRARLTNLAQSRAEVVDRIFVRFAIERLLYRLSESAYRDHFVLKGAMLFSLWAPVPYRSTGDLDLLGQGDPAPERMAAIFKAVCAHAVTDDGLTYDAASVRAESARDDEDYSGVRVTLTAALAGARLPIQIDIGFGDAVMPDAAEVAYPSLLDFPSPLLRAYPPETVVAEKLEALVSLGMRNSRMKDFFDLWAIARTFEFDGRTLARAVAATFARRGTAVPDDVPVALTEAFARDAGKQTQWKAFLKRTTISMAPEPLPELIAFIASFVSPLLATNTPEALGSMRWQQGGPWLRQSQSGGEADD